ncbi:MAG: hypothetical protein ABI968_07770 [Acidobacteriota bacterium]
MRRKNRCFASILSLAAGLIAPGVAPAAVAPFDPAATPAGSELFAMPRQALLFDRPNAGGKVVAKLESGTHLRLLQAGSIFFKVEVVGQATPSPRVAGPSRGSAENAGVATGYIAADAAAVFVPGAEGVAAMVSLGTTLSRIAAYRTVGAALLLRGTQRLRENGTPDASLELLLGETAEALARDHGRFPTGLAWTQRPCRSAQPCIAYSGDAFARALELSSDPHAVGLERVRERALVGMLRSRFPEPSDTLTLLWQETAAWLDLTETAQDAVAVRVSSDRLGIASLSLGRYLLATGKLDELSQVEVRVRRAALRVAAKLPGPRESAKLFSRAELLRAMRGNGSGAFPQEARVRSGEDWVVIRIDGSLGALALTRRLEGQRSTPVLRTLRAVPVLPLPGSLRLSPDGRTAAWIEVASPSRLMPVLAALDPDEPAREIGILAAGRPLRDRSLEHVLTSLEQFSADSQRLGFSMLAWNEVPGPKPRLLVVSSATGQIVLETSNRKKAFRKRTR